MMKPYTPANWYWYVAGDLTQVYSSAAVAYVVASDPTFVAWLAKGNVATKINSEQELFDVLLAAGVPVPGGTVPSDAAKNGMFDNVPHAVQVWAFAVDNRVRVLEGLATRTPLQFRNYVKGLM